MIPDQTHTAFGGHGETRSFAEKRPFASSVISREYLRSPHDGLTHVPTSPAPDPLPVDALPLGVADGAGALATGDEDGVDDVDDEAAVSVGAVSVGAPSGELPSGVLAQPTTSVETITESAPMATRAVRRRRGAKRFSGRFTKGS